jgi:hypothetical protein
MRTGFLLLAALAAFFLVSVTRQYLHEESEVDDCLSEKHGSFDYSIMSCDLKENHIYVPYRVRHPHDKSNALIAFVAFVVFLSGYRYMKVGSKNA